MSLLLDALKKAEQAKRKAQQDKALTPAPELLQPAHPVSESFPSLELAATVEVAAEPSSDVIVPVQHEPSSLSLMVAEPELSAAQDEAAQEHASDSGLEFNSEPAVEQSVSQPPPVVAESKPSVIEFTPEPKPVWETTPKPKVEPLAIKAATASSPEVAQRILAAGKKPESQRRRLVLILLGLLLGLLLGGLYLFGPLLLAPSTPALVIPPQASSSEASPAVNSVGASAVNAAPATTNKVDQESVLGKSNLEPRKTSSSGPKNSVKRVKNKVSTSVTVPKQGPAAETPANKGPVLENTTPQPGVAPLVAQGYAAYQRGDLELAAKKYRQAVNEDDQNRDALLGLAATARRLGDLDTARRAYKQLLYLNPRDVDAKAGLSAIQGVTDPQSAVEAMKPLSERETDSATVQSELGAMYVRQGRWSEAQAAYFNAFSANPANPDLAFNLAVCLDHLNQPKLALDYYRKAKQLGARNSHRFDSQQLDKRVSELEGAL